MRGTVNEMEPDGLRTMFEVNTLAALELIGWSSGLASGSVLTLLSSNLAQHPLPHTVGYGTSKAAVEAACRVLLARWGGLVFASMQLRLVRWIRRYYARPVRK